MMFWNWSKNFNNESKDWMKPSSRIYRLELTPIEPDVMHPTRKWLVQTNNSQVRIGMEWKERASMFQQRLKITDIWVIKR